MLWSDRISSCLGTKVIGNVLASWARRGVGGVVIRKYHKPGGLKQHKYIVSQFWRLEVQNQGVGRTCSF